MGQRTGEPSVPSDFELAAQVCGYDTTTGVGAELARADYKVWDVLNGVVNGGECRAEDCSAVARCKGFCKLHYNRSLRHGDPSVRLPNSVPQPEAPRFFAKLRFGPRFAGTPCLLWTAATTNGGYGHMSVRRNGVKTPVRAHRWLYERWVGPIPEGMVLDHLCRNVRCVNPMHLEVVTPAENTRRAYRPIDERSSDWAIQEHIAAARDALDRAEDTAVRP